MRTLFLTCFIALCSLTASAQVDAKLNVGSAIFGGLGLAADFTLSEKSSVSAGVGYASNNFGIDDFNYSNVRIIPEYRYYFNPREGADRFFVGGYGKLGFISATDKSNDEKTNATRAALGILFGNKWVTDSGFLFELNLGLGRATVLGSSEGDEFDAAFSTITALDFRLGIIAGYRF